MNFKRKLLFFEGEMTGGEGHHLDNLIEATIFFKKKFNIIWFANKNFEVKKLFIPYKTKVKKIINTNRFIRNEKKLFYFLNEIIFFFNNIYEIIFFTFYFFRKKKLYVFIKTLISNYLVIPRYFGKFYLEYIEENIRDYDQIVIQSCRTKDIALIYFLTSIEKNIPKIHIRVLYPPKNNPKGFFFYLNKIKEKILNNQINIYSEIDYSKELIEQQCKDLKNKVFIFNQIYTFHSKEKESQAINIGFVGDARVNKGFNQLPEYIEKLYSKNKNIRYLIQFSKINNETAETRNILIKMASQIPNLEIIEKYCDYLEYRNLLKKINIMPLMYSASHLNVVGSGVFYSCLTNEISLVIPSGNTYLKKLLKYKCYEEAEDTDDFVNKSILMAENYSNYLREAKKQSAEYKFKIKNDPLVKRILNT
jgi:hypothetical protein